MAKKINIVLEGRFKGREVYDFSDRVEIMGKVTKERISSYQLIDETNKSQYSFLKGAVGAALFGGIGAIAGIGGKNKKEYLVAIEWADKPDHKDGNKSLVLLGENAYKNFMRAMF